MDINSPEYKLSKAKAQLIIEHPFYASLLCNLPFVEKPDVKTMAVDGKNVYYNPEFVMSLSLNELKFVEAHEVMHCVMSHMTRRGSRDPLKWNKAGDYVINEMLVTDGVGTMPQGGLHNPALTKAANYTTDGVYNLLPDDEGKGDGHGGAGGDPLDEVVDGNPQEAAQDEADWKIRTIQAGQVAKMSGKLPAGAARLVDQIANPVVPWQKVLERFVSKRAKTDRTFAKPNRRFLAQGMYLPTLSGESLGKVAIAVDCSGSISDAVLQEFAAEIHAIKTTMRPSSIDVYYFDSEVSHEESYSPDEDLDIRAHGGGGTAFSPVINAINAKPDLPVCCVFLTDLYCSDFGDAPEYPVLWVTNGATESPWGEVVKM